MWSLMTFSITLLSASPSIFARPTRFPHPSFPTDRRALRRSSWRTIGLRPIASLHALQAAGSHPSTPVPSGRRPSARFRPAGPDRLFSLCTRRGDQTRSRPRAPSWRRGVQPMDGQFLFFAFQCRQPWPISGPTMCNPNRRDVCGAPLPARFRMHPILSHGALARAHPPAQLHPATSG